MRAACKSIAATLAAGAMLLGSASPAAARDRDWDRHRDRDRGGIDAGDVLAGAAVLGGIAAIASIAGNDNRGRGYDRDRRYRDNHFYRQDAVDMCVRAAERTAARYNYGSRAEVYQIRDVDQKRNGLAVKGRIAVQERGRQYRSDRWDEGKFTCEVRRGRIVDLDYSGIRGL